MYRSALFKASIRTFLLKHFSCGLRTIPSLRTCSASWTSRPSGTLPNFERPSTRTNGPRSRPSSTRSTTQTRMISVKLSSFSFASYWQLWFIYLLQFYLSTILLAVTRSFYEQFFVFLSGSFVCWLSLLNYCYSALIEMFKYSTCFILFFFLGCIYFINYWYLSLNIPSILFSYIFFIHLLTFNLILSS